MHLFNVQPQLTNATIIFENDHSARKCRQLTKEGFWVAFSAIMGLPIPGAMGVVGVVCNCHGAKRNNEIDAYHAFTCKKHGYSQEHDKLMRQLLRNFVQSSATITVIRGETRGQNFLNGTAGQGGPDAHIQDGDNEFLDASGINGAGLGHQLRAHRLTKPAQDQDKIILAAAEQEGTRLDHKPNLNSIEYREHEKHNGTDAKEIRRSHQKFSPLVFSHTGGISTQFTKLLYRAYGKQHISAYESKWKHDDENQVRSFARILATTTANTAAAHMKMNLQHYYKTLHGPKADPVELNLWTMIPMSTTARAMLDPEADKVDEQTDTAGLY
jgi:hypothetical protein